MIACLFVPRFFYLAVAEAYLLLVLCPLFPLLTQRIEFFRDINPVPVGCSRILLLCLRMFLLNPSSAGWRRLFQSSTSLFRRRSPPYLTIMPSRSPQTLRTPPIVYQARMVAVMTSLIETGSAITVLSCSAVTGNFRSVCPEGQGTLSLYAVDDGKVWLGAQRICECR